MYEKTQKQVTSLSTLAYQRLNATEASYETNVTLNELFAEIANKVGEKDAVICHDDKISYRELHRRSMILASQLRKNGISKGDLVGIMTDRSIDLFISILGVLQAGAGYVPMDSKYPGHRLQYILEASKIQVLLVNDDKLRQPGEVLNINVTSDVDYREDAHVTNVNEESDIAYVIFTSGSTGNPKGVAIQHEAVVNFIYGINSVIRMSEGTKVINATTDSFDIFVYESLAPLLSGATVILADEEEQKNVKLLSKLMEKYAADIFQTTPSKMSLLLAEPESAKRLAVLKSIVIGGEPFPNGMLEKIKIHTGADIYNFYGPTEATVWATYKKLNVNEEINIGQPLPNYEVYIIDDNNQLMPVGENGEIGIAGKGLAKGYLYQDKLTEERFISFTDMNGEEKRLYKTGDLGRVTDKGEIQCMGRKDNQIKLRGYRIELGEIENACLKFGFIKEIAVLCIDINGEKALVAYYVADEEIKIDEMREALNGDIPAYMIPQFYVKVSNMPLNTSGKVDRIALAKYEIPTKISDVEEEKTNLTEIEEQIARIWKEVLGRPNIGLNDNFFNIGGTSMLLLTVYSQIEEVYPDKLTVLELFDHSTIREIASFIERSDSEKVFVKKGIVLPEEYTSTNELEVYQVLKEEIRKEDVTLLFRLGTRLNVQTESIFMAMFHYILYQTGEADDFSVPMLKDNKILDIMVDYEEIEDMESLIKCVDDGVKRVFDEGVLSDTYIGTIKYEPQKIYPLFYREEEEQELKEWSSLFDLTLKVQRKMDSIVVQLDYRKARLLGVQVAGIFENYMELIHTVIENIKE